MFYIIIKVSVATSPVSPHSRGPAGTYQEVSVKLTLGLSVKLTLGECLSMGALTLQSLGQAARNLRQVHRKIARKIFYSQRYFQLLRKVIQNFRFKIKLEKNLQQ